MAFTYATTRADTNLIDESIWNTDLVDNINWCGKDKPICRIYNSSDISVASGGSGSALTFDSEDGDNGGMHSGSSSEIVIVTAGWYLFTASIEWDAAIGNRTSWITHNSTNKIATTESTTARDSTGAATPYFSRHNLSMIYPVGVGDTIELVVFQDSGGSVLALAKPNYAPALAAVLLQVT